MAVQESTVSVAYNEPTTWLLPELHLRLMSMNEVKCVLYNQNNRNNNIIPYQNFELLLKLDKLSLLILMRSVYSERWYILLI